jgi:hypothetical protein
VVIVPINSFGGTVWSRRQQQFHGETPTSPDIQRENR